MVIVSQDKEKIVNFDNCADIHISNTIKKEYDIIAVASLGMTCKLGEYKTEERAKEVLQEIVSKYKEYATISNVAGNDIKQIYTIPRVYEMQEE